MIINPRCFSCNRPISHLWQKYKERTEKGEDPNKVMNDLGLTRYCCRAMFLGQVDLLKDIAEFKKD